MSLTTRRKAATEQDIARAAGALFAEHGTTDTTVEEIAERAGVGLRTFYRYFRSKQDAVAPLLAFGAHRWQQLLATAPPELPADAAVEYAARHAILDCAATAAISFEWIRGLLRAAEDDPALRAVWLQVNDQSEQRILKLLAARTNDAPTDLHIRLLAAAATTGIRVAIETWALSPEPTDPERLTELTAHAVRTLTAV